MPAARQPRVNLKDRRARRSRVTLIIVSLVVVAIIIASFFGLRRPEVTLSHVAIDGATSVSQADIQTKVDTILNGSYGYLIPKRFTFLAPLNMIAASLMATYPEIGDVVVRRTGLTTMIVHISERVPYARWCTNGCYSMDDHGFVFAEADGTESLRTYHGKVEGNPIGQTYLPNDFVALDAYVTSLETLTGKRIRDVNVSYDRDVFATLDGGGEVRFVLKDQGPELSSNMASVFASPAFQSAGGLDYADFRFGQKAIVKFLK